MSGPSRGVYKSSEKVFSIPGVSTSSNKFFRHDLDTLTNPKYISLKAISFTLIITTEIAGACLALMNRCMPNYQEGGGNNVT